MSLGFKGTVAMFLCKALRVVGKAAGKGSSLPGAVALKVDGRVISKIKLPAKIIAVTGSNGKTSTVEMLVSALKANGLSVAYNSEGANQLDGVATFVLSQSTYRGVLDRDVMVVECDEQSARHIFRQFKPSLFVITNLYRDQLSRNGHPERIFGIISESISDDMKLLLNADDPLTASFGHKRDDTVYFGVEKQDDSIAECRSVYDDGCFCPVCGERLEYSYRLYNHIGGYKCTKCDFSRPETKYSVGKIGDGQIVLCGKDTVFPLLGLHNVHNMLAAYAAALEVGCDADKTRAALSECILKSGRTVNFKKGYNYGTLLISKHENSIAYDCSIRTVAAFKKSCTVMILVDSVSRKYFTSDTSWLYDIDFEQLNLPFINEIILAGKYCHDLAVRFSLTDISTDKITVSELVEDAMEEISYSDKGRVFILTCFSDKAKALSRCELLAPDAVLPEPDEDTDINEGGEDNEG